MSARRCLVDVDLTLGTQNFFDVYNPAPASREDATCSTVSLPPGGASQDPWENSFFIQITEVDLLRHGLTSVVDRFEPGRACAH